MATIETESTYAFIKDDVCGEIPVYIDASYAFNENLGRRAYAPFASGWSIEGHAGIPFGYGMTLLWDIPTRDSAIAELRTILAFLDNLHDNFPQMLTRSNVFHIHCDNLVLITQINNASTDEDFSRKSFLKYGKDYARLVYYMTRTKLKFSWVKGHATNEYNRLADLLARRCFQAAVAETPLVDVERRDYIRGVLITKKMVPEATSGEDAVFAFEMTKKKHQKYIEAGETKIWKTGAELLLGFKAHTKALPARGGFAYLIPETSEHGYTVESIESVAPLAMQARAVHYALFSYRMSEGVDLSVPLTIRTSLSRIPSIVNLLSKGLEPPYKKSDTVLHNEIESLKVMLSGMKVRVVSEHSGKLNGLVSMASIALEDHGVVSYESEEHMKRIQHRLKKIV